jgi:hypothetical protein
MPKLFTIKTGVRKLAFGSQFILFQGNLAAMDLRSAEYQAFKLKYFTKMRQWLHTIYAATIFTSHTVCDATCNKIMLWVQSSMKWALV